MRLEGESDEAHDINKKVEGSKRYYMLTSKMSLSTT